MINIGGGFPSDYLKPTKTLDAYSKEITRFLKEDFGEKLPEIIVALSIPGMLAIFF